MLGLLFKLACALAAYLVISNVVAFRKNLAAAKASGIHYIVVPVFTLNPIWLPSHRLFYPLFRKLPRSWMGWLDYCVPASPFDYRYEFFSRVGHDTILTVSPGGCMMYTCEPAVITQITTKRQNFPKPTQMYRLLDIYGKNVVTTERDVWRVHRKAVSPPFTEKNNHLVWIESIRQAEDMVKAWAKLGTVKRVMDDTMRLSLNVISAAGFGRIMDWPTDETEVVEDKTGYVDPSMIKNENRDIDPGHTMSYTYAIHCLLDNILVQFLLPRWLLKNIPLVTAQKANEAYHEWGNYMKDLLYQKKEEMKAGSDDEKNDILTQLVRTQLMGKGTLTESEVLGNMFTLILAGHETAANSIHFAMVYLALHPESQKRLQKDLDKTFQGRPTSEWDYEQDLPSLFGGMPGAVLAEELRLVPPVIGIPKSTMEGVGAQKLTVAGKECLVPANTYISLNTAAAHRHPGHWPISKPSLPGGHPVHPLSNIDNDLEEFRPERWILTEDENGQTTMADGIPVETLAKEDGLGVNESSDTSDRLYRPVKGSYLPFSEGYRACIGRRFAQVEVLAVLAVIFTRYTVELAGDASEQELSRMTIDEKAEDWQKAAEHARWLMLEGSGVIITLQLRKGNVPVRLVPRGQERFPVNIDMIWQKNHPEKVTATTKPSTWRGWDGFGRPGIHAS